jgi:murein DD-endopeptidase MepM/ murein hydrolase activator NlpD
LSWPKEWERGTFAAIGGAILGKLFGRSFVSLLGFSLFLPGLGWAQSPKRAADSRSPRTATVQDCGSGVTLTFTRGTVAQGALLELTLHSKVPVSDLKGEWGSEALPFWQTDAGRVDHALLGIDLERKPGPYEVQASGTFTAGGAFTCSAKVDVGAGKFAIERLKVARGFVDLSPQDGARAVRESEHMHAILARVTPERLWTGRFRFPLAGRPRGHNFGRRRVLNGEPRSPHTGLDIPASRGTPIHAAQSGRVVLAENMFFSGNTVILDHGLGIYTFYGHMKRIGVKEGEEVKAGAIIGLVGSTGRATGPHLHWGLIVDGARVNPLGILRLPLQ